MPLKMENVWALWLAQACARYSKKRQNNAVLKSGCVTKSAKVGTCREEKTGQPNNLTTTCTLASNAFETDAAVCPPDSHHNDNITTTTQENFSQNSSPTVIVSQRAAHRQQGPHRWYEEFLSASEYPIRKEAAQKAGGKAPNADDSRVDGSKGGRQLWKLLEDKWRFPDANGETWEEGAQRSMESDQREHTN